MSVRRGLGWLLLSASLCLTGCLDYAEQLVLNEDGSGTLGIDFTIDMGFMAEIARAFGEEPDPEELRGPTREELMQGLEVEGIEVRELEIEDDAEAMTSRVHVILDFDHLGALEQIEGFGDDRRIEFFHTEEGEVRMVYRFDTRDVVPLEEVGSDVPEAEMDPIERKIFQVTQEARDALRFRARVALPGPLSGSNGSPDPEDPTASRWRVDKRSNPARHERLGRGEISLTLVAPRSSFPFLEDDDISEAPDTPERD